MAKLIINPTSTSRREIALARSLLSIGRDPSNDLVLPDAMVSRRHAVIEYRGVQYFIRDCNSSNGSLVNGDRISERGLRDGDLVAIGTARLLFREEAEAAEVGAKVVPHPSAPRQECPRCGVEYRRGDFFCRQCGEQIAANVPSRVLCTACGTSVQLPAHFCNACGATLTKDGARSEPGEEGAKRKNAEPSSSAPAPPIGDPGPRPEPAALQDRKSVPEASSGASSLPPAPARPVSIEPVAAVAGWADAARPAPPLAERRAYRSAPAIDDAPRGPRALPKPPEVGGFGIRLVAGLIDAVLVSLGQLLLLSLPIFYWSSRDLSFDPGEVRFVPILLTLLWALLIGVLGGAYYVYFWGVIGATPGKKVLDLAVTGEEGEFPIGVPRALGRLLAYLLSFCTLGVGFLMITGGAALHDRIAGTRVVRRRI